MVQLLGQLPRGAQVDIQLLDHVDRQANSAGLVHDCPLYSLANPPGRIGRESKTALRVELLHRPDQAQVALLDQVQQGQPAVDVAPGNFHHQAQVALDHPAAATLVTTAGQAGIVFFLIGREQGRIADFVQVQLGGIQGSFHPAGGAGPGLVETLELSQLFRRQLSIGTRILFLLASRLGIAVPLW